MRLIILLLCLTLPSCALLAKQALSMLDKGGVSVDAQVGDRNNSLGDSIGEVEAEVVTIDQGSTGFSGDAKNVTITDTNYTGLSFILIVGLVVGFFSGLFVDLKKLRAKRA